MKELVMEKRHVITAVAVAALAVFVLWFQPWNSGGRYGNTATNRQQPAVSTAGEFVGVPAAWCAAHGGTFYFNGVRVVVPNPNLDPYAVGNCQI
jgi:hypothetical protein